MPPAHPLEPPDRATSIAVGAVTVAMVATWLPQYLAWPWWPDLDAWATLAQGWDAGMRPYRDIVIFNFPGQIYLCWVLGKIFGWGHTAPFYALDAALVMTLGATLVAWGRRRFGSALPGLIGWAATLAVYLDLDYGLVAQRDWQGPLLAILGLITLQTWRSRVGYIAAAMAFALGFAIRPHVVLFLPPAALILAFDDARDSASWRSASARVVAWGAWFALFVAAAFLPLAAQGLLRDFVRGVRQASYGSGYGQTSPASAALGALRQLGLLGLARAFSSRQEGLAHLGGWKVLATALALVALPGRERRRLAWPWAVAVLLAVLYEPLHPKRHAYLALPLRLTWAVSWGVLAGVILERLPRRLAWRRIATLALMLVAVPGVPTFCRPADSWDALRGSGRTSAPATASAHFFPDDPNTPYRWDDYRAALAYLRRNTTPSTRVAVALRTVPFPAFNGVLGRVSPWPAESGVIWLWSVNPKLEPDFVAALEAAPEDTVVVWSPDEKAFDERLKLTTLCNAIRRLCRGEAKFGAIEVWRKR